jgi:molybdopterin converting factor small subunit
MKIRLVAFGISRDIIQSSATELELKSGCSIAALKDLLVEKYPEFGKLRSISFAVEEEYREDDYILNDNQEVVIIPPVSGG